MRKKVLASTLSVLLAVTSTPIPAIGEEVGDAQPVAVEQAAAQEEPASDGTAAPVEEGAAKTDEDIERATTEQQDEQRAEESVDKKTDAAAVSTEPVAAEPAAANPAQKSADATADVPAVQSAGDPYETVAPAYDAASLARIYGAVSYNVEGGSANSTTVVSANNIANVGAPTKDDAAGGWSLVVTLKSGLTAADFGLAKYQVGGNDPAKLYVANGSNLNITFKTDSAKDSTWGVKSSDRAQITFTAEEQKPEETAPAYAFNIKDVLDEDNAVHYYANGSKKHSTSIGSMNNVVSVGKPVYHDDGRIPYWSVDVTIKGAGTTAADYNVPTGYLGQTDPSEWVFDESKDNDLVTTFVLYDGQSSWRAGTGSYALLHFKHEVPAPSASDVASMWGATYYTLRNDDGTEGYTVATQLKAENLTVGTPYLENGTWKTKVTIDALESPKDYGISVPAWYDGEYQIDEADSDVSFTLKRGTDGAWAPDTLDTAKLVFNPIVAPAFDINGELNIYGTVVYNLKYADGTVKEDNGTHLVSADNIASVGKPYQTEDGCWAVDVTLKDTMTPGDLQVPNWQLRGGEFELDKDASDLTLTFRTLSSKGTTWYCSGADRADVVFVEKAAQKPDDQKPGEGDEQQKPGDQQQPVDTTKVPVADNAVNTEVKKASDTTTKSKKDDGEKLVETGDPLGGMVAIAAGGVVTLVAGYELKRRGEHEGL